MATLVEELCDDVVTEAMFTAKGTDVFFDQMPDVSGSPVAAFYDLGGIPAMNTPAPQMMVGVRVRATDYETARATAADLYNRYHGCADLTLTAKRILSGIAESLPSSFGEDANRRHIVGFNIVFKVVSVDQTITITATGIGGAKDPNREN